MWTFLVVPFVAQWAHIDRITGSWAVVEIWNGDTIALQADCLAPELREGSSIYITEGQIQRCLHPEVVSTP